MSILGLTGYLAIKQIVTVGAILASGKIALKMTDALRGLSEKVIEMRSVKPIFQKFEVLQK